ncbi:PepSY domain-containing protein [Kineosporia sp. R_H_3]|uniref:PepSY-associated TM helix domain-containing protein n=1 Tax=Kineosporia sp. R_H_3 TaxID=1961848 RepID=UPI000B4AB5D5|nr:PepSY domain-containing protein [Kineosporia sp. R_H_3]
MTGVPPAGLRRRATTVAVVATGVTTTAHESAHVLHGGPPVPLAAVAGGAVLAAVLLAVAHEALAARRAPGPVGLAAWLVGGQVVVHACLDLAAGFATGAPVMPPFEGPMPVAHAAAAVVHAVLVCGTHRCLRAAGVVVAAVVGCVRTTRSLPALLPAAPARRPAAVGTGTRPARRLATVLLDRGVRDRRGPPSGRAPPSDTRRPARRTARRPRRHRMSVIQETSRTPEPGDPEDGGALATADASAASDAVRSPAGGLFGAFWRWHFYASVLVIPILFVLATTGLFYMYRATIDPLTHPGVLRIDEQPGRHAQPLSVQQAAVEKAFPGTPVTAAAEGTDGRTTKFSVSLGEDATRTVYVNQYTAEVLGDLDPKDLWSDKAIQIHGTLMAGRIGDGVIEVGVCWAIVMALTGYYLYWKGRAARAARIARGAKAAVLRHRHATYGAIAGVGILFLVVSGLPWTGFWGEKAQNLATGRGTSFWGDDPGAESTLGATQAAATGVSAPAPWALGETPVPASAATGGTTLPVDAAVRAAQDYGLAQPYVVYYPDGDTGVYSIVSDGWNDPGNKAFQDITRERAVHVDQYTGRVLASYGYQDYSLLAKGVINGIALHEGRRFGTLTQITSTLFCLGVIFLCISAPILWWKRRPAGSGLAAPRGRMPLRRSPFLAVALVALAVLLPLFGATLLAVLVLDQVLVRRIPALRRAFGTA